MGNGHCASLFKIVIHMYIFLQTSSTVGLFVSSGRVPYTIFAVVSELFGAVYREAAPGFLYRSGGGVGGDRKWAISFHP